MKGGRRLALLLAPILAITGCAAPAPTPLAAPAPPPSPPGALVFEGLITQGAMLIGQAPSGTVSVVADNRSIPVDADGRFVLGLGRDAPPAIRVEARTRDGASVVAELAVQQRRYDIQSLPTLRRRADPSPEYEKLRSAERARIVAARAQNNPSDGWQQRWIWPVSGRMTGVYGSQRILGGVPSDPHYGVDVAGAVGTPIVAPADGVVVLGAPPRFSLEGNLLIIDHGMGVNSAYLHLNSIDVVEGAIVRRGQRIGTIGATGRTTGPHLHWGVNWRDVRIDPALLVGPMPAPAPR